MPSARTFFESGPADRLMDPAYYPAEITEFLRQERKLLNSIADSIDLLIEVGCMHGTYLDWAVGGGKQYIGIDIVLRHIQSGQRTVTQRGLSIKAYRFILGSAEELAQLIEPANLRIERERCLIFFPFNIIGAVSHIEQVIVALRQSQLPFLISSYQTTKYATACRYEYYRRCGCKDILLSSDEVGTCFQTSEGFRTIAYYPEYLQKLCSSHGVSITAITWSSLNIAYVTETVFDNIRLSDFMREEGTSL